MNRHLLFSLAAALALGACSDAPTTTSDIGKDPSFITDGDLDGNAHPAVVLIVGDDAEGPLFRCSGTLISATVVLTAGHCTADPGITAMRIFTESDVQNGDNEYPHGTGNNTIKATEWHAHDQYTDAAFFLHDVGVIKLEEAVDLATEDYGTLPGLNQLDALRPRNSTRFTAVGYGLQRSNPVDFLVEAEKIRMKAEPHLVQINVPGLTGDFSLLLSNNAATGGTCFGDSGGPNYLGSSNVIAGVTSFGLNGTCGGTGGVFRLDRADVLEFVNRFLD